MSSWSKTIEKNGVSVRLYERPSSPNIYREVRLPDGSKDRKSLKHSDRSRAESQAEQLCEELSPMVRDDTYPGSLDKRPSGSWRWRVSVNGRRHSETWTTELTKDEAAGQARLRYEEMRGRLERFQARGALDDVEPPPSPIAGVSDLVYVPADLPPGVYFLCDGGRVAYVGQSVSPLSRIATHHRTKGGRFDRAYLLPLPQRDLNAAEQALIRTLDPPLNQHVTPGHGRSADHRTLADLGLQVDAEGS